MLTYFIPLTANLTKNSKLEKFVHELNALWKLSGSSMGALRELVAVAGIQNDQIKRVNNLSIVQGGTYGKWVGHSMEFVTKKHPRA